MSFVKVDSVSFSYGSELILDNITIDIQKGEFVCFLGESGCGKSTLLKLIAGLERPQKGEIIVNEKIVTHPSLERGIVFQNYSLFPWLTTGKNILIALKQKYPDISKEDLKKRVFTYLERVGLDSSIYEKYPHELSGGMKQRCAICRAFALDPPLLLMDEPFGALDAVTRHKLQRMTHDLWESENEDQKRTTIFVTHDIQEAILLATSIYVLGYKPTNIIYSYKFNFDKSQYDQESLMQKKEVIDLKLKLMDILNENILSKSLEKGEGS